MQSRFMTLRHATILRICLALPLLAALHAVSGCDNDDGNDVTPGPEGAELVRSDTPRDETPEVSDAERDALGAGNQAFALDLYQELRTAQEGNLFLSPFSISMALAMTYVGAEGATESQMAQALHFTLPEPTLHAAFNAADLELQARGKTARGTDNQPFRLHIVNQTWGQVGFSFLDPFLQTLAVHYGAGMFLLDFASDPEGARGTINDWVADQTEDRIRDLIPMGVIDPSTRLVLTNAIYFNGAWNSPFDREDTEDGPFFAPEGAVTVPLMRTTARLRYTEGDGYQAVELPYDEQAIRFIALLPAEGRFDDIEQGLNTEFLRQVLDGLGTHNTTVTMPRFEFESPLLLNDALKSLGMVDAFEGTADFSGIDGARDLYIQGVVHKAFVSVNEEGTEAAAATAVVVGETSAPEPAEIRLDRPFLFLILDEPTGQVLFFGRLINP